ncbi:MAG: VTT domain-containing protein [Magnetospirillum sp.]|nr:VTT domain-containing protein [Magnetospirillum sp.]
MNDTVMAAKRHPLLDPKVLLRGLVLIATLAAVGALLELVGLKSMLESGWVDSEVRGKGLWGEALFILVGASFTALGMPRQVVSFLGGYAFGFLLGTLLSLLATLMGALGVFYYARFMGRDFLARRFPGRVKKIDDFLSGNPMTMALVLRLSPFSSNLVANLAAGVSGVRALPFFAGSAIGYLPQTIVFALLGGGMELDPVTNTILSAMLFVVSTVLGLWLWRRYRKARGLPEDEES